MSKFKKIKINETLLVGLVGFVVVIGAILSYLIFKEEIPPSSSSEDNNYVWTWDAETASSKKYESYEKMEQEFEVERIENLEVYNKAIKGTVVEQVQNIAIPSYSNDDPLVQLQEGEVEVREPESDDFPNGIFNFGAYLVKNIKSFTVGDFNNDGLDDVAHIIAYTGGGSGMYYNLTIFINNYGKLKYLTQEELGDRVVIKSVKYNSGMFTVDIITQGEGDDFKGYCCPNVPATIKFRLENGKLTRI